MQNLSHAASMTHRRAALTASGAVALFALLAAVPIGSPHRVLPEGLNDAATFATVVTQLRAGDPYYEAYGQALRRQGYPARSVFNWRTPLLLSALARLPDMVSRTALALLGLCLVVATHRLTAKEPLWVVGSDILQAGAVLPAITYGALMMGEAWAGLLIGLSACLFATRHRGAAVALGLLALFLRELAMPYCAACAVAALVQRRWRELAGWLIGAALYGVYYALHLIQVRAHQLPTDVSHRVPWWNIADLSALMAKAEWHAWLLRCPPWLTALVLVAIVLATVCDRTPLHVRLATGAYLAFFLLAGQPFNDYWGLVAWPVWAVASGYGLQAMADAVRTLLLWNRTPQGIV